jgi:hypothetical protein
MARRLSMISASHAKALKSETERCAKIAENFPTNENSNLPNAIAQEIRRPVMAQKG